VRRCGAVVTHKTRLTGARKSLSRAGPVGEPRLLQTCSRHTTVPRYRENADRPHIGYLLLTCRVKLFLFHCYRLFDIVPDHTWLRAGFLLAARRAGQILALAVRDGNTAGADVPPCAAASTHFAAVFVTAPPSLATPRTMIAKYRPCVICALRSALFAKHARVSCIRPLRWLAAQSHKRLTAMLELTRSSLHFTCVPASPTLRDRSSHAILLHWSLWPESLITK
jgi:hypothetical protein